MDSDTQITAKATSAGYIYEFVSGMDAITNEYVDDRIEEVIKLLSFFVDDIADHPIQGNIKYKKEKALAAYVAAMESYSLVIALHDNKAVGMVMYRPDLEFENTMYISVVFVAEEHRGNGVGTTMLKLLREAIPSNKSFLLGTYSNDVKLINFYKSANFTQAPITFMLG